MQAIIPNSGLDNFCLVPYPEFAFYYAAVGSGSTPKDINSTGLTNEIARVDAYSGAGAFMQTTQAPSGSNLVWTVTAAHVFSFGSAVNLNEYAYFGGGTGATAVELFRDTNGNPVTVSIPAGGQLRLNLTATFSVPLWGSQSSSVIVDGVGTIQGHHTLFAGPWSAYGRAFLMCWPGSGGNPYTATILKQSVTPDTRADLTGAVASEQYQYLAPYTGGDFKRRKSVVFEPSHYNGPVYGATMGSAQPGEGGYLFVFDNPAFFVKTDTQRLTLDFWCSVERA